MTTFDLIALLLTILIVVILLFFGVVWKLLDDIKEWQKSQYKKLDFTNKQIAGIWRGQDKIENNAAILSSIVDKMHRNLCVEIADEMVDRVYPPTYNPPCYAPNGICTNPQMDCINCPKRGTGGTWSTSTNTIKVKGKRCELTDEELMKRINEDNKED